MISKNSNVTFAPSLSLIDLNSNLIYVKRIQKRSQILSVPFVAKISVEIVICVDIR